MSLPVYVQRESHNNLVRACAWMRPEFRDVYAAASPYRVHSGSCAQKYFSFGRMHESGLMQQVSGITPNITLTFSAYMQAWMCLELANCQQGRVSDAPGDMHLRVGLDPYGGTDPLNPHVVWSAEKPAWDSWVYFEVQAAAESPTVTVFTHSRAEWPDLVARMNNDVYVDDARLRSR